MVGGDDDFGIGRVLVVADDGHWLREVAAALREDGYRPLCTTPTDARRSFVTAEPDVLVHGGAGDDDDVVLLVAWVRSRSACAIVVMPEVRHEASTVRLLEAGADAVLGRRTGSRVFLAFLRSLLRRRPPRRAVPTSSTTSFGGLEFDRSARQLLVGATSIRLDEREVVVVELLVDAAGAVLTRSELADRCRISTVELDGLVRRVRQRLEGVEGWRRLVNVRSVGFRLLEAAPLAPYENTTDLLPTS